MAILAHQEEKMRTLVTAWAQINSGSTNPKGLATMQKELAQTFSSLGGTCTELPIGLSIKKHSSTKRIVFLGGHMDTVFGPDHPFQTITDLGDRLQGPGVTDMKGGLVVMFFALQALENSPHASNIGWEILINNDEERGSPDSAPYLQECAKRCSLGLVFEPSFADGALASARKGSAVYHVHAHGQTAHVGRDPEHGKNAVLPLARFVTEINSFQDLSAGIVINVGSIQGGSPCNVVPDYARLLETHLQKHIFHERQHKRTAYTI